MVPNFEINGKIISPYMITALIGILSALYFCYKRSKKDGLDEIEMISMVICGGFGIIIGGHLMASVPNWGLLIRLFQNLDKLESVKDFFDHLIPIFGGSVFYGGLFGCLFACDLYLSKKHLDKGRYFDIGAVAIPLFHFFGRIGCFLGGCCYGVESKFGFTCHYSLVEECNGVRRFPVQLLEAGLNLLLFFFLLYCLNRGLFKRRLLGLYMLSYPLIRYIDEFYRGDEIRGFIGPFSTSQFISLIVFVVTAVVLLYMNRKKKDKPKPKRPIDIEDDEIDDGPIGTAPSDGSKPEEA